MFEWKFSHIHCKHSLRHLETESGLDALRRMADAETIVAISRRQTADEDEEVPPSSRELLDSLAPIFSTNMHSIHRFYACLLVQVKI